MLLRNNKKLAARANGTGYSNRDFAICSAGHDFQTDARIRMVSLHGQETSFLSFFSEAHRGRYERVPRKTRWLRRELQIGV